MTFETASRPSGSREVFSALGASLPVVAASVLGGLATYPEIGGWYAGLAKPSFNPPNSVFGPVWTTLYALMAFGFWRVLRRPGGTSWRGVAIILFFAQIVLNTLWSFAFFAGHSPGAGLAVIAFLWLAIVANIVAFAKIDRVSAWTLAPYLAWVSFAAALNFAIWQLN